MPKLNTEGFVRQYLASKLSNTSIYTSMPNPRPKTFVVVSRNGGSRLNRLQETVGLDVFCYAPTKAKAFELSSAVSDAMFELGRTHILDGVDSVKEETCYFERDPDTQAARYYFSFTLYTHKY